MNDRIEQIVSLINKYQLNELSPEEQGLLDQWLSESEGNRQLFKELTDEDLIEKEMRLYATYESPHLFENIIQQVRNTGQNADKKIVPNQTVHRNTWKMYVAAVAILAVIILGVRWLLDKQPAKKPQLTTTPAKAADTIKPATSNKGNIILSDNSKVYLDRDGHLAHQAAFAIHKNVDTIAYEKDTTANDTSNWHNTFNAPRGSLYTVILPNGIKARLTPASTIRFDVSDNKLLSINVKGEVGISASKGNAPFIVHIYRSDDQYLGRLEVIGTTFNIDASDEEEAGKITLVEGVLKVFPNDPKNNSASNRFTVLKPGQQARLENGRINIVKSVDTDAIVAWQKGKLEFNETPAKKALNKLETWYDFEIDHERSNIPDCPITITIHPNMTLQTILEGLKLYCPKMVITLKGK